MKEQRDQKMQAPKPNESFVKNCAGRELKLLFSVHFLSHFCAAITWTWGLKKHSSRPWAVGLPLESAAAEADKKRNERRNLKVGQSSGSIMIADERDLSFGQAVMVLHGWDRPSVGGRCRAIVSSKKSFYFVESLLIDWSHSPLVTGDSVLLLHSFWKKKWLQSCKRWRLILCVTWLGLSDAKVMSLVDQTETSRENGFYHRWYQRCGDACFQLIWKQLFVFASCFMLVIISDMKSIDLIRFGVSAHINDSLGVQLMLCTK